MGDERVNDGGEGNVPFLCTDDGSETFLHFLLIDDNNVSRGETGRATGVVVRMYAANDQETCSYSASDEEGMSRVVSSIAGYGHAR